MSQPEQPQSQEAFSLRPATPDDLKTILEIEHKVHTAPWSEENFKSELAKPYSHTLLLTDDETDSKIAGYIVFWIMEDAQILNVAVDLPYRGLGFAKKMIRQAITQAAKDGLKRMTLEVRKTNQPAIQLYQNIGFGITHVRRGFYTNGEDAYHMTLSLDAEGQRDLLKDFDF